METGQGWRLGHRPALDGVRGIAVLLVVIAHTDAPGLQALGPVGVTMFFALSGFLITALLLEERGRTGRVSMRAFYLRRARRLFPALVAMLLGTGVLMFALGVPLRVLPVLGYCGNWVKATGGELGPWNHTWSLAIEEQFYLVWPVVLLAVMARWGRRGVLAACAVGAAWSVAARLVSWHLAGFEQTYFRTDERLDGLLLGAALAVCLVGRDRAPRVRLAVPAVVALVGLGLTGTGFVATAVMPGLAAAAAVLLVASMLSDEGPRWLRWSPLVLTGRRSYGLYLWHYPMIELCRMILPPVPGTALGIALAVAATAASWRLVEAPFLGRRSVGAVELLQQQPDDAVVLPRERLDLSGDLRVRR